MVDFVDWVDYEGASMLRDANQKAAAAEATNIFQNHYPEFLVRTSLLPSFSPYSYSPFNNFTPHQQKNIDKEILHQRPHAPHMGLLALQTSHLRKDSREIHSGRDG